MRIFCLTIAAAILITPSAYANTFGTRDIHVCALKSAPASGPITPGLAAQYFTCDRESMSSSQIVLIENVQVQVGAGRPWQSSDDYSEIDMSKPIYPIRGSFRSWTCSVPDDINNGKSCFYTEQPQATGACYQTTFGDWHCNMNDLRHSDVVSDQLPPR